ncbi:MAG: excinuclease ABC subunit UvrC [Candidatus Cyclobacteriaceae bacterium M2_1C_046]
MITSHRYLPDEYNRLPQEPGVYKFFGEDKALIYVGKAKNLRKRVSSYFTKAKGNNRKTQKLVSEIKYLECIIAPSEFEALLLENNLIKENQPKYNILLKDDKTFPFIIVTKERFPRILSTRKYDPTKGEYFGPYSSVGAMNNVLELIRKLYTIRTCKLNLSKKNVDGGKFRVCLEYHIGNCLGPCENHQTEEDYQLDIDSAREVLKGNLAIVRQYFENKMNEAAQEMAFEEAQQFKEKTELLEKFRTRSLVVSQKVTDLDVFTLTSDESNAYINYMQIKNGSIIFSKNFEVRKKLNEPDDELLTYLVYDLRIKYRSTNTEILTELELTSSPDAIINTIPKIGDKKKLLELSKRNALLYKKEKAYSDQRISKEEEALFQLKEDLNLNDIPKRIECFDNSNFQGSNPVASMVYFIQGKPSKKNYRKYNIKTVIGPNDFASMHEIVYRRYKHVLQENEELPGLIVIDGGKGQLSAACEALKELQLYGRIPIIGIAKRLEEIYYPEDSIPLHINKKSQSLKLIQRIRDEAHRFAITFHRQKRSKSEFITELEDINGIGKATADQLLKHFKSVKKIKNASVPELEAVVGKSKALKLIEHYKAEK